MQESELQQFALRDKFYIMGRISDVTKYLKSLSSRYRTVKEYLEELTKDMV
jgi:hypothetical protein